MMKSMSLVFLMAYGATAQFPGMEKKEVLPLRPGAERLVPDRGGLTLRQWMEGSSCMNIASQPLMNTQFAQLGALDALHDAGLMKKVTGLSGVSSGAFVMALAATQDPANNSKLFRKIWPGWANMVPEEEHLMLGDKAKTDPILSKRYEERVLSKVLPQTFEELKIPLAIVATKYEDKKAAAEIDGKRAQPFVISDGKLAESVIVSSSAMMGPGCPDCDGGFKAKNFRGHWPTADGFLLDEYGTLGLHALRPCDNLLHFQPVNYAQQLSPTKNVDLDTQPKHTVTLGIDVPSSGIMSMQWDGLLRPINNIRKGLLLGSVPLGTMANQDEVWEKLEYESAYDHMMERLDQPMHMDPQDNEKHHFVDLNLKEHWKLIRGWGEKAWDNKYDGQHGEYWDKTADRRAAMIHDRTDKIKSGKLSYRACGNGLGAPKCNQLGQKIPKFHKGQEVVSDKEGRIGTKLKVFTPESALIQGPSTPQRFKLKK